MREWVKEWAPRSPPLPPDEVAIREPGWLPLRKYLRGRKEVLFIRSRTIFGDEGCIQFVDGSEEATSAREATQLARRLGFKVTKRHVEHDRYHHGVEYEARPPEDPQAAGAPVFTCHPDISFGCLCARMPWDPTGTWLVS